MFLQTAEGCDRRHSPRQRDRGFIDKEMLDRYLKKAPSPIYYIAGPPVMVNALRAMLQETGISRNDIRAEEFAGY